MTKNVTPKRKPNLNKWPTFCLMAHEEDNEVSTSNSSQFTLNELQDAFDDLFFEFKKMGIKNSFSKR